MLRVDAAPAVLEDDRGERLVEPLVAAAATQAQPRDLFLGRRCFALESEAADGTLDEFERLARERVGKQRLALLGPHVAVERREQRHVGSAADDCSIFRDLALLDALVLELRAVRQLEGGGSFLEARLAEPQGELNLASTTLQME